LGSFATASPNCSASSIQFEEMGTPPNFAYLISMDLPLVIEIVDTEEKINAFLPTIDQMMKGGLITLEKVRVIDYRSAEGFPESTV